MSWIYVTRRHGLFTLDGSGGSELVDVCRQYKKVGAPGGIGLRESKGV